MFFKFYLIFVYSLFILSLSVESSFSKERIQSVSNKYKFFIEVNDYIPKSSIKEKLNTNNKDILIVLHIPSKFDAIAVKKAREKAKEIEEIIKEHNPNIKVQTYGVLDKGVTVQYILVYTKKEH